MNSKVYYGDRGNIFKNVLKSAKLAGFNIDGYDLEKGLITASTRLSFLSWGESLIINVSQNEDGGVIVSIGSESQAQIIDWGKNQKNIDEFFNHLDLLLD